MDHTGRAGLEEDDLVSRGGTVAMSQEQPSALLGAEIPSARHTVSTPGYAARVSSRLCDPQGLCVLLAWIRVAVGPRRRFLRVSWLVAQDTVIVTPVPSSTLRKTGLMETLRKTVKSVAEAFTPLDDGRDPDELSHASDDGPPSPTAEAAGDAKDAATPPESPVGRAVAAPPESPVDRAVGFAATAAPAPAPVPSGPAKGAGAASG
jgi:hypothetical protein